MKHFIWLIAHSSIPTRALLHHRNIGPSDIFQRCNLDIESNLHCLRDCPKSSIIWTKLGISDRVFFFSTDPIQWIKDSIYIQVWSSSFFLASIWKIWKLMISHIFNDQLLNFHYHTILTKINYHFIFFFLEDFWANNNMHKAPQHVCWHINRK